MKQFVVFTFLSVLVHQYFCVTLPSTFTKCDTRKSDFHQCLSKAIQDAISQLDKPLEDYRLPNLEPLVSEDLAVEFGDETTCMKQKFTNFKIHGLTKINTTKAEVHFENQFIWINITFFELIFEYNHEMRGKVIVLPIDASVVERATFINPTFRMRYKFEQFVKQNQRYDRVVDSQLIMEAQNLTLDYGGNFFDSERLNEEIVAHFNEKWQDVLKFFEDTFPQVYVKVFEKIFNDFLDKVPFREILDG
ncbi:hypothetical protein Zmor_006027 [Zophobas morio]|uniref:Protein takeout n=1 Tax=Zophobas morio TaxID=2755281 RepID=A0AA38IVH8_9CUCU|nr:hypothetical protein Zmor_006027 [Zophobas morio]